MDRRHGRSEAGGNVIGEPDLNTEGVFRALLAPRADGEKPGPSRVRHIPMLACCPSRLRDGPEVGDERLEPFGRLDAQLEHQ
jgi:hypothetical protein